MVSKLVLQAQSGPPSGASKVGGILLAAGAGRRMGDRPKCLLMRDGLSLLQRHVQALSAAGLADLVVVLGHHAPRILQELAGLSVRHVVNPDPDAGHVGSLRAGLSALPSDMDGVIVMLADQVLIDAQDVVDVLHAFECRPKGLQMLQPSVQGQPGHPVVFSAAVARQILAGDAMLGVRQWQVANPSQVYPWPTPNAHYCTDVDSPQDLHSLASKTGIQLLWPHDLKGDHNARKTLKP